VGSEDGLRECLPAYRDKAPKPVLVQRVRPIAVDLQNEWGATADSLAKSIVAEGGLGWLPGTCT
jgi:hypothetical protein